MLVFFCAQNCAQAEAIGRDSALIGNFEVVGIAGD
jgi:hypothetical protein